MNNLVNSVEKEFFYLNFDFTLLWQTATIIVQNIS